jgi:hypothetical protein
MPQRCANCATTLLGEYCHTCGQRRHERLTVSAFRDEVLRRVFRLDRALASTFWRLLHSPGRLVDDYLAGRRQGVLDPVHFYISSVFIQVAIAVLTRAAVPLLERTSTLPWLERLGGIVVLKIVIILWMASIWRLLFRAVRYNLAEVYAFATYAYGTIGLLWAAVPIVDLLVPLPLGPNRLAVVVVMLGIEVAYVTHAVAQFARLPLWLAFGRVTAVLAIGYGVLVAAVGLDQAIALLLPPMPAR